MRNAPGLVPTLSVLLAIAFVAPVPHLTEQVGGAHTNSIAPDELQSPHAQLASLSQNPESPLSGQPVFVSLNGTASALSITFWTNATLNLSVQLCLPILGCSWENDSRQWPFNPTGSGYQIPFVDAADTDAYIGTIPGLPSYTWSIFGSGSYPCPLGTCTMAWNVSLAITSSVNYYASNVGSAAPLSPTYHYAVQNKSWTVLPPLMILTSANFDPTTDLESQYYGLSNPGMVSFPGVSNSEDLLVLAEQNLSGSIPSLQYNVTSSGWLSTSVSQTSLDNDLSNFVSLISGAADSIFANVSDFVSSLGLPLPITLPSSLPGQMLPFQPLFLYQGTIPPTATGNYVVYRGLLSVSSTTYTSPEGLYYITDPSGTPILLVDPHPFLWILSENEQTLLSTVRGFGDYLPAIGGTINSTLTIAESLVSSSNSTPFEYLNSLAQTNDIYVSFPGSSTSAALSQLNPKVIILDDLSLGLQTDFPLTDWDLSSISENGSSLQTTIIQYAEDHNAGVIATAGTFSDAQIWYSPEEEPTSIGAPGDIGNQLDDANPLDPTTLATFLGLPTFPLFEFIKNLSATSLYETDVPAAQELGEAIGSTPLFIPDVPWNGTLNILNQSALGDGLGSTLDLSFPNLFSSLGSNASTAVGWQLDLPLLYLTQLFQRLNSSSTLFDEGALGSLLNGTLSAFGEAKLLNSTNEPFIRLSASLEYLLNKTYRSLIGGDVDQGNIAVGLMNQTLKAAFELPPELLAQLSAQLVAVSPDYRAGILVYDRSFVSTGYRAAYLSFDPLYSNSPTAEAILRGLVTWSENWTYRPLAFLHNLPLNESLIDSFLNLTAGDQSISGFNTLIPANGNATSTVDLGQGNHLLDYISPYAALKLTVANKTYNLPEGVGELPIESSTGGPEQLVFSSDSSLDLNPTYIGLSDLKLQASTNATVNPVEVEHATTIMASTSGGSGVYTSYRWGGLPKGCNGDGSSFVCVPSAPGGFTVWVNITDSDGNWVNSSFALAVNPTLTASLSATINSIDVGQATTISAEASGGSGSYSNYQWFGLPGECAGTGASIVCTPVETGTFTITVNVTDTDGNWATSTAALKLTAYADPVVNMTSGVAKYDVDQMAAPISVGVDYSGLNTATVSWFVSSSVSSCSLSGTSLGSGTSFTPNTSVVGTTNYCAVVADSGVPGYSSTTGTGVFTVTVYADPTVSIPHGSASSVLEGSSVTFSVDATPGSGGLSYSWIGLPQGCSSEDTSTITCTPTAAGTYHIMVTVADSDGVRATSPALSFSVDQASIGLPAVEGYALVGGGIAVVAVLVAAMALFRIRRLRSRRPPNQASAQPPPAGSQPPTPPSA
jgi:hypothetical protein